MAARVEVKAAVQQRMPSFVKGHTPWNPKLKMKDGLFTAWCGDARITASSYDDLVNQVRIYANAHGWKEATA